jgi:nucleoside-diphosphate-sugar epimerase
MQLHGPKTIQNVEQLEDLLSTPSEAVVEMMRRLEGDIIFLGVGGKIGPSLARMARRASDSAGVKRRVIGVSRFTNRDEEANLNRHGVETIRCNLLDETQLAALPSVPNVFYLAGLKFGSSERIADTWAMNTYLPALVCRQFRSSRIVAYSTGAIYGLAPATRACLETDAPIPVGEYAMSCLGRERMLEYFSRNLQIPTVLIRLFYACEMRYGVFVDLARKVFAGEPIDLSMGYFNLIWQGDNNAMTLLALEHAATPPLVLNVTGPERLAIRDVAEEMGRLFDRPPIFSGSEQATTCLGDTTRARELFGLPRVSAANFLPWVVDWVRNGHEYLGKPTHFEVRDGLY